MNILRRLPLSRLLLLCGLVIAVGASLTAIAFALSTGPTPPARPLAEAAHEALASASGKPVAGFSANIKLTNRLLEGADLAGGGGDESGGLASNPLINGASGRLWISNDGRARLELQSESGDTQIIYDGHTLQLYDAATNTLYRYTPPSSPAGSSGPAHEVPSLAKIEEAISHLKEHANVSTALPTDVGGQPAYTVRVSPKEAGGLYAGAELSWDADNGVPLRAAIYSSASSSPVIELAASDFSFAAVPDSVFEFTPRSSAKIEDLQTPQTEGSGEPQANGAHEGKLTVHGHGPGAVAVLERSEQSGKANGAERALEGLPKVSIDGTQASELRTELGTLLSFERAGVRYLLAGSVTPATIEALARGL